MTQETISRAELDADRRARRHDHRADLSREEFARGGLERRMFLVAAMATGLIIGAMQLD